MDLNEFANIMKQAAEEINAQRQTESARIANDAAQSVRLRVETDQTTAEGGSFGTYSEALVPQWMLTGRSQSGGADDIIKAGPWFQSYADLRAANNLNNEEINFKFTGQMWDETGIINVQDDGQTCTATIGGQTPYSAELIGYHSERFGNILELSETEETKIYDAHRERITNIINKYIL
tara:strand:- start:119 stop:655 length:537 start_codon:yes stop_codon:yes gene_type:complete